MSKSGTLSFLPAYNNATNQISSVGSQTFRYDLNGNLQSTGTGIGSTSYTWDAEGHMLSATPSGSNTVSVTYDALGRAVEVNNGNAPCAPCQLVYDPTGEALASTTGQTPYYARVPLPGGATAIYVPGPSLWGYWHRDWLGSLRLTTLYSRTVSQDGAFAPYGESYASWGTTTAGWFAGMEANTLSTMSDAAFRRYDPTQGRWLSPDPGGLSAADLTNPQSLNRYSYALNNPTTLIDPLGLDGCQPDADCVTVTASPFSLSTIFCFYGFGYCGGSTPQQEYPNTLQRPPTPGGRTPPPPSTKPAAPKQQPQGCIPPATFAVPGQPDVLGGALALTQILARLTSKTIGIGIGGGFGFGIGGSRYVLGFQGTASVAIATDANGNSALLYGGGVQLPSLMHAMNSFSGLGGAANIGLQLTATSQSFAQLAHPSLSFSGSYGPAALDLNAHGVAATYGFGVGSRVSFGPSGSSSNSIPICHP